MEFECPPKPRHLLWRACKKSLPVNAVRHHRHMCSSAKCSRCNKGSDTIYHALFDRSIVRGMWESHPFYDTIQAAPHDSFANCLSWLLSHSTSDGVEAICASMWACWFARSKEVLEGLQCDIIQLSTSYFKMLKDYQMYAEKVFTHQATPPLLL